MRRLCVRAGRGGGGAAAAAATSTHAQHRSQVIVAGRDEVQPILWVPGDVCDRGAVRVAQRAPGLGLLQVPDNDGARLHRRGEDVGHARVPADGRHLAVQPRARRQRRGDSRRARRLQVDDAHVAVGAAAGKQVLRAGVRVELQRAHRGGVLVDGGQRLDATAAAARQQLAAIPHAHHAVAHAAGDQTAAAAAALGAPRDAAEARRRLDAARGAVMGCGRRVCERERTSRRARAAQRRWRRR